MDHGGHGGVPHGGMDHGSMSHDSCNMSMTWNWETTNVCILTSSWRITTPLSLYLSLLLISLTAVLYEYLRLYIRRLDARLARNHSAGVGSHRRRASVLPTTAAGSASAIADRRTPSISKPRRPDAVRAAWVKPLETSKRTQIWRSALYATSIGMSFALMLISMTFNGWVIGAIVVGKYTTLFEATSYG